MSSVTVTHPPNYVPAHGIPIKIHTVQGSKKRNRQRKVSGSSSGASSTDELAPKSVRMDKEAFYAAIAKAQAQPVVKNPRVFTTEDLKYGYYGQNKVQEVASAVPIAPPPASLTMSFSSVAKAATTPPPLDFESLSPSPSSRSASSNSTVEFPALAASSAPIAKNAPVAIMTIKPTSTMTKSTNDNSSSWNTVASKHTNPTKTMHIPVTQNVWASKPVPMTSAGVQATNNTFHALSDPAVVIPEKKKVTQIDRSFFGPEVTKSAIEKSPKLNHTRVEVSSKKQNTKTDKKSHVSNVPAKPQNNKFEVLISEPKSKAPNTPASKKREQTVIPVEKPTAPRSASGSSSEVSSDSSSSKKSRAERKKGKKTRSEKAQAALDSAPLAIETKSTAYRLSSDSLSAVTVVSLPIKTLTGSKQNAKPVSESKSVASSSSEPIEFKDSEIANPTLADTATPKVVESKEMKAAEILSTLVTEVSNEVDVPSSLTDPKEDTTKAPESTPLTQQASVHSTLESRVLLCHGSDDFDEELEAVRSEQSYEYTKMESRFGLQNGSDDFDEEVEVVARTEEPHEFTAMESRFALQHGSDDFDDEIEAVLSTEEPRDYTNMESRFHLQHGSDDFDEEIEIVVPVEESYDYATMELRSLLQHGSDDFDEGDLEEMKKNTSNIHACESNTEKTAQHDEHHDATIDASNKKLSDAQTTKPISTPEAEKKAIIATEHHQDSSPPSPQAQQHPPHNPATIFLGTISLLTFTSQLTTHTHCPTPTFTAAQITTLFASFAAFERMYHNTPQLPGVPTAQDILASTTLLQQIKLGRTKLGEFLSRIRFEGGVAGLGSVVVAFEMAADEEEGWRMGEEGGRVGRAVGRWL